MAESRAIPGGADRRAGAIVRDRTIADSAVTVVEVDDSSELRAGSRLLMVVAQQDGRVAGAARASLAAQYASNFETATPTRVVSLTLLNYLVTPVESAAAAFVV
jgi:hypothetical protein